MMDGGHGWPFSVSPTAFRVITAVLVRGYNGCSLSRLVRTPRDACADASNCVNEANPLRAHHRLARSLIIARRRRGIRRMPRSLIYSLISECLAKHISLSPLYRNFIGIPCQRLFRMWPILRARNGWDARLRRAMKSVAYLIDCTA